jgi:hypothetical protein
VHVIFVEETTTTLVAAISLCPVFVSFTVAPDINPVPARFVILTEPVFTLVLGVILVTVGAGYVILNPFVRVADRLAAFPVNTGGVGGVASEFVTTTSQSPVVLPDKPKEQVIFDEDTTVTLVAAISVCPVFTSLTVAPARNPVPARFVMFTEPVLTPMLGVMLVIVGADCAVVSIVTTKTRQMAKIENILPLWLYCIVVFLKFTSILIVILARFR